MPTQQNFIRISIVTIGAVVILGSGAYLIFHGQSFSQKSMMDTAATEWKSISTLPNSPENNTGWYWVNEGDVYCMGQVLQEIDRETFVVSEYGGYAKDKNHVYRCSEIVKDADADSFAVLNFYYAKDSLHVFTYGVIIEGADPVSFEIVPSDTPRSDGQSSFGKDKNYVYFNGGKIQDADPKTFTILNFYFAKDKNWVYKNGRRFGPAILADETYADTLPQNCQGSEDSRVVYPSIVPAVFSEDGLIVGYRGLNGVCILNKRTGDSEYYQLPGDVDSLSKDGSKIVYIISRSEGIEREGLTCEICGTYEFDRFSGKIEKLE